VADLTRHIKSKYGCDAESMRVQDPDDPTRSIRVTTEALRVWSRAILHNAQGVDFDNPPKCRECVSENVRVQTLTEIAGKLESRLARHRRMSSPLKSSVNPLTTRPRSSSPALEFTPTRRTASGRVLPPRLIPSSAKRPAKSRGAVDKSAASPAGPTAAIDLTLSGDSGELSRGGDDADSSWRPSSPSVGPGTRASTDIEVVPDDSVFRSPSRKLARSPVGEGIAPTFSRLAFERPRSPPYMSSVSPTRKRPGSQSSSYPPMDLVGKPPLNDLGRALTMDGFLSLCNFTADDHVPRVLISLNHIRRWDFFLDTTFYVLQKMGFPYPIASQLLKGARWLEASHLEHVCDPTEPGNGGPLAPDASATVENQDPGPSAGISPVADMSAPLNTADVMPPVIPPLNTADEMPPVIPDDRSDSPLPNGFPANAASEAPGIPLDPSPVY
jgi:hypothetical protein